MEHFVQTLVDAVSVGSLYALTALGIGLIFGVMRLINFAHGELITFAAYALLALFGLPVPVMLFGAIVVAVLLALITERAAFRPLRSQCASSKTIRTGLGRDRTSTCELSASNVF